MTSRVSSPCRCMATTKAPSSSSSASKSETLLCSSCVRRALHDTHKERQKALSEWHAAREECSRAIELDGPECLSELQESSRELHERVDRLRQKCSAAAVAVCAAQVENEKRQQYLLQDPLVNDSRQKLQSMHESLCGAESGAMIVAIDHAKKRVRALRFQWALAAFKMHRLDVELNEEDRDRLKAGRIKHAKGIGKIGGLPLPHAGPELFVFLPPNELQSALRLVASLTSLLAQCLGIVLPHPILLTPDDSRSSKDIADFDEDESTSGKEDMGSSTSSLVAMAGRATRSAISSAISSHGHRSHRKSREGKSSSAPTSMAPVHVSQRIKHSAAAVLAEDELESSSMYTLSGQSINEESFAIALQLLQNNVIALCIRAGVPVANLWPAEAVLLNLHALGQVLEIGSDSLQ